MKSLERRFLDICERNPGRSSVVNLNCAVKGQKFTKETLSKWFTKLVDPNEYEKKDRPALLGQLWELTNL